jgi:hypothetical protein
MAFVFGRSKARPRRVLRSIPLLATLAGIAILVAPGTARASDIVVTLDQAQLVKLPERAATVVIGNPLIADAAVQAGGTIVVTGKGYGTTNLIALDRAGGVLMESSVEVHGPAADTVVVYRGIERETYSCTPACERRITLGDSKDYFNLSIDQTGDRNGKAQGLQATK